MVTHKTKKRPVKQKTKKCPDCGRETVVDDKWSSCQWCHWPLFVKPPPGIEQRKSAPWTPTQRYVVACVVVVIISYWLIVFGYSGWKWLVFQQLIMEQSRTLLLLMFALLGIVLIFFYGFSYLVARTPPEAIVGALVIVGIVLLLSSLKGNLFSEPIRRWIEAQCYIDLFSASVTVLSLAFTFAAILMSIRGTKK
jgi:hypothetical protein